MACGWTEVKAAAATFILKDVQSGLCGVLVLHVDDGLCCGTGRYYEDALKALQKRAPLKIFKKRSCDSPAARLPRTRRTTRLS